MTLELESVMLPEKAEVKIQFSITTQINITDISAQRKISKLLLDQVGNLLYGEKPNLVVGRHLVWRVPVWLGLPTHGPVGQVGFLDIDAQTGEILFSQEVLEDLAEHGDAMAERAMCSRSLLKGLYNERKNN